MEPKLLRSISVRLPEDLLEKVDAKCEANSSLAPISFERPLRGGLSWTKRPTKEEGAPCQLLRRRLSEPLRQDTYRESDSIWQVLRARGIRLRLATEVGASDDFGGKALLRM